jgi:hypothetical protein
MEIGAEAAQFPEKEYINEIFIAVQNVYQPVLSLRVYSLCVRR